VWAFGIGAALAGAAAALMLALLTVAKAPPAGSK
jgi:hypothetical protein